MQSFLDTLTLIKKKNKKYEVKLTLLFHLKSTRHNFLSNEILFSLKCRALCCISVLSVLCKMYNIRVNNLMSCIGKLYKNLF